MNTKYEKNIKELIITGYKILTYAILWFTFIFVMSRVNYALTDMTRTFIVTSGSFVLMLLMMQTVYGNFEIGQKKSKPVFLTTMISVLIANFVAALAMIVMGIVQFPLNKILLPTLFYLLITYILQALVIWFMAHMGNELYFKLYKPAKTLIFNNDNKLYKKIYAYVSSHDKQYEIVDTYKECNIDLIKDNSDVMIDRIYALGFEKVELDEVIYFCYRHNIHLIYDISECDVLAGQNNMMVIDDVLMTELVYTDLTLFQAFVKRTTDILGALVLTIIAIPIFIIVSIAIKFDDGGPILYSQERLTKNGKLFKIYKFRSMKMNSGHKPVSANDDRITKVGHIIRKLRIDELPQVINMLKGDISLVGPRPESLGQMEVIMKDLPNFDLRLKVKAGLTGYAQIFGKYNTTPEMKLILDLNYITNYTVLEDFKLILQTLIVFIKPDSTEAFDSGEDN